MREKYNIKKKSKRNKNKRAKTGEETEGKNLLLQQNKKTLMDTIKDITKQSKDKISNAEPIPKASKKRAKLAIAKRNEGTEINDEKWNQAIQNCEEVLDTQMAQRMKNKGKDRNMRKRKGKKR